MKRHGDHHHDEHHGGHAHHVHGHTHGVVDPSIVSTDRGLWALKWSFVGLIITAGILAVVWVVLGRGAVLAGNIYNLADAPTDPHPAPASLLARRPQNCPVSSTLPALPALPL